MRGDLDGMLRHTLLFHVVLLKTDCGLHVRHLPPISVKTDFCSKSVDETTVITAC